MVDFDVLQANARHGTRSRYKAGCRCEECREANAAYQRDLRRREREGTVQRTLAGHRRGWFGLRRLPQDQELEELGSEEPGESEDEPEDEGEGFEGEGFDGEDVGELGDEDDSVPGGLSLPMASAAIALDLLTGGLRRRLPDTHSGIAVPPVIGGTPAKARRRFGKGSPEPAPASPTPGAPDDRLGHLTEAIAARPGDPGNAERLVEAVPLLRGGLASLRQYGERHGVPDEVIRRAEARARA